MRILLLISILTSTILTAQIPNPGFETWVVEIWQPDPEGWTTPNDQLIPTVYQDTNAYEGNFAMRVEAVPNGIGAFGWAECEIPIDYIPSSLDFYAKALAEFGGVSVSVSFFNGESLFNTFDWSSGASIEEWTLVSIPLVQNEPVLTHAVIRVEASVGDLVPGEAWISVDAMGFDAPLSNSDQGAQGTIQLFPNPASDKVYVQYPDDIIEWISIYDSSGKLIAKRSVNSNFAEIDISGFPLGMYNVVATPRSDEHFSKKLLIAK